MGGKGGEEGGWKVERVEEGDWSQELLNSLGSEHLLWHPSFPRALPTVFTNNQILRMPSTALSGIFSAQKEENLIKVIFNLVLGVLCSREL